MVRLVCFIAGRAPFDVICDRGCRAFHHCSRQQKGAVKHRRISLAVKNLASGPDAPTTARKVGLPPMGFSPTSMPEGFQRASGKPFGAPVGAVPLSRVGIDAPTPARIGTGRPKWRSHFSFDGERKVCKRKPAARRLQRRPAPLRTAAKPCATLVLGYALHGLRPFLALVGLRPPLVAGFGLR